MKSKTALAAQKERGQARLPSPEIIRIEFGDRRWKGFQGETIMQVLLSRGREGGLAPLFRRPYTFAASHSKDSPRPRLDSSAPTRRRGWRARAGVDCPKDSCLKRR